MRRELLWTEEADSLRDVLMNHRNEIRAIPWRDNYQPYVTEALRLINAGQASDGHTLLKRTLTKWTGMAPSRSAYCIALCNLTDHAIARLGAAKTWQINTVDIRELRGKADKKRRKSTLSDTELQFLINGVAAAIVAATPESGMPKKPIKVMNLAAAAVPMMKPVNEPNTPWMRFIAN